MIRLLPVNRSIVALLIYGGQLLATQYVCFLAMVIFHYLFVLDTFGESSNSFSSLYEDLQICLSIYPCLQSREFCNSLSMYGTCSETFEYFLGHIGFHVSCEIIHFFSYSFPVFIFGYIDFYLYYPSYARTVFSIVVFCCR